MKGYSKIKLITKSRSMDFSDQTIPTPRIQKPISINKSIINHEQPKNPHHNDAEEDDDDDDDYKQYSSSNHQEEDGKFPMKMLARNYSAAASSTATNANSTSSRFKIEKQNSTGRTLQTAVKRVLSIRRSSSVSERYSRIHDQYANPFDDHHHEEQEEEEEFDMARSKNKMKKHNRGRILKACKRVFGL